MSERFRLALLCGVLCIGAFGIFHFSKESPDEIFPVSGIMPPPELTCNPITIAASLDTLYLTVDSLISMREDGVTYKIRRRPDQYCVASDTLPSDSVRLCCADVGRNVLVWITATNSEGDSTSCLDTVLLQDKLAPYIAVTLPDVTVSCDFPFNFNRLDTFGTYLHPDEIPGENRFQDDQIVDDQVYYDFCDVTVSNRYLDQRNCGTGIIERYISLADDHGNSITDTQLIVVINSSPFDPEDDIDWPNDTTITLAPGQCVGSYPPQNLGGLPVLRGHSPCVMPSFSKSDMVFNDPLSGCPYIMRTWKVVEMCTYRPNVPAGIYEHVQNIYIRDTIKPNFEPACKDTILRDVNDACNVLVNLTANATDNCTRPQDLLYTFTVSQNGNTILTGNTKTITHTFALGNYDISWTADDRCGNTTSCSYVMRVRENKAPTPMALQSLAIGLPQACSVTVKAVDFNVNSSDNCTPVGQLKYSFSNDVNDTLRTFGCADLGNDTLKFWVTDLMGNQARVNVYLNIQDNYNHCPNNLVAKIEGNVMLTEQSGISEVKIILEGAEQQRAVMTDEAGNFSMSNLETNVSYFLTTKKEGEFLEGVNIMDLIELQKDFYGIKKFDSNRQKIAADIDGNGRVDGTDLNELRRIILGIRQPSELTPSWRVVDYTKMTEAHPWPLKENFIFKDLSKDEHLQLQAIKIGDIDGTSVKALRQRNSNKIVWYYPDQTFKAGDKVILSIRTTENIPLTGANFTLQYDQDFLTYKNPIPVNANITTEEINALNKGMLKICHINAKGSNINAEGQVFDLEFVARKAGKISELIQLTEFENSFVVSKKEEIFFLNLMSFEPSDKVIHVAQNVPNPFDKYTSLTFEIKDDMPVEISIYDQTGRKIFNQYNNYTKGSHQFEITEQQLGELTGVFLVHIECAEVAEIRKILRVK
jgi:hypothetical protein